MINKIRKFIQKEDLLMPDDQILLAVSGGMDSMCLLDIFRQLPYSYGVAHVNHQLRGAEADADQQSVERVCQTLDIPFYSISIDVKAKALAEKANISDTGRTERYNYFNLICQKHGYTKIATAHHANDDIETLLMRMLDGSGLRGLSGIPLQNGITVRPMLTITREEIVSYANQRAIAYREDASNAKEDYFRNAIRHQIIPKLTELKPSAQSGMLQSIDILKDSYALLQSLLKSELTHRIEKSNDTITVDIPSTKFPGRISLLYYCLEPYGFTRSQILNMAETTQSGAQFDAKNYKGIINRGKIIISKKNKQRDFNNPISINDVGSYSINKAGTLAISSTTVKEFELSKYIELIDAEKVVFPILVRHWQQGDTFSPLGMNGQSQSLQDFFTNQKLSIFEKNNVLLVESGGKIIWIIGHRIANQVKITPKTKRYLKLEYSPNKALK